MSQSLRMSLFLTAAFLAAGVATSAAAQEDAEPTAEEIIDQAVERNALGFDTGRATIRLTVFDREGEQRERLLDVRSRRVDDQTQTVMTLTEPPQVEGQAFLFHQNADGADDMWMHVPAFEVTRRVEGSQRRSSFLGTHFTFADLESRDLRDASYEKQSDQQIGDYDVHVVEATPENRDESDYDRVVAFVRTSDYIPIRIRFYDQEGELDKTLFTERLATTDEGTTYVEQMTLRSESGGYTRIEIEELDPNVELPASLFDREELGR